MDGGLKVEGVNGAAPKPQRAQQGIKKPNVISAQQKPNDNEGAPAEKKARFNQNEQNQGGSGGNQNKGFAVQNRGFGNRNRNQPNRGNQNQNQNQTQGNFQNQNQPIFTDSEKPSTSAKATKSKLTSEEIKSMWACYKVRDQLGTSTQCIKFAEDNGLVLRSKLCSTHRTLMGIYDKGKEALGSFCCRKGTCRSKSSISRAKYTWFENAKLSLPHIFYIMYGYAHRWPQFQVRLENYIDGPCLSSSTISDWFNYCREAVVIHQINATENLDKIGGPGKVVQIDETKFGKEGKFKDKWVLGFTEDGSEDLRVELFPQNVCSEEVVMPLILKNVIKGTTIRTDCWKAFGYLTSNGYEHRKVGQNNLDNPFVAPDGSNIIRIESQWRAVKRYIYKSNYNNPDNFAEFVVEFIWRKTVKRNREDPFLKLIEAIQYTYTP